MFVVETSELSHPEATEIHSIVQSFSNGQNIQVQETQPVRPRLFKQLLRFGLVGGLNTLVDLLILNGLLVLFPTTSTFRLLAYNLLAYSVGAVNSFLLNKYWTFGHRQRTTRGELLRFSLTTLCGIGWSSVVLWIASNVLHPFLVNATVWANASKIVAIGGTSLISYLGMRLWVFVSKAQKEQTLSLHSVSSGIHISHEQRLFPVALEKDAAREREPGYVNENMGRFANGHRLSIVLPAYNEEEIIASTVNNVLDVLSAWHNGTLAFHWKFLICFQWKVNRRAVCLRMWKQKTTIFANIYSDEENTCMADTLETKVQPEEEI